MTIAKGLLAAVFVVALAVGCGGSSNGSGGSGVNVASECASACSAGAQACGWGSAEQSNCSTQCQSEVGAVAQRCSSEASAVFTCAKQPSAWDCTTGEPQSCYSQLQAFEDCQRSGGNLEPFCDKCAACVSDPTFQEGFCSPWVIPGGFDRAGCYANGNWSDIDSPTLTAAQINAMSCLEFDNAI